MKTKIYIVRHTETIGNIEKRLTGREDYELTDNGKKLVQELTDKLKNIKFDKIYCSTSNRTLKTIKPLSEINNLKIEQLEDLCEMYFGIYDGWKWEEVNKVQPEIKENQNITNEIAGINNQETMEQVANRMFKCIKNIAENNIGKTILICSHGVVIEAFLRKIANLPFKYRREDFCQHNTDVNEIEFENGKFHINEIANKKYFPLISVIVPIYKVEKYIHKCIDSIISQTYKNLQLILVDDGSPDDCGKICDDYMAKDERVEVIHKANGGLSDARNVGIRAAVGEYIGFVDGDDYIENSMYGDMYNLIEENKADVSICNFYNVIQDRKIIKNQENIIKIYNKMDILKEILLDKDIQSYAWNKLYKKELFDCIEYPVGKKYEDIGTTFYLLEKCEKIVVSGKPLYYYLDREDSIVNTNNEQTIIDYIDIITHRFDYIKNKYPELEEYNINYLEKILKTANNDVEKLENVSIECKEKIKLLDKKVKENKK